MTDDLAARHRARLPNWLALYYERPIELVRGEGRHVWDAEGNRYLDFFGGILTTISGHNVSEIVDAIQEQVGKLLHTSTVYLIRTQVELAEKIAELSPIPDAKVFFTASGSEANETALLLAATYRRSNQVLALRASYHGRSFATVAVTGNRGWSASSLTPLAVSYVHGGYMYRSPYKHLDDAAYIDACCRDLRDVIDTATAGDVACMIVEPIQGVGGFGTPPDGLFGAMQEILDEYGILLISDEVQTGWGRTGEHFWGIDAHGAHPQLMTFAKGVANGLTMGGVIARPDVMDSVTANSISTFGGNPVSCAGALANLDYLLKHDLQANAARLGPRMKQQLIDEAGSYGIVGDIRGKGLMIGIELVDPDGSPAPGTAARVLEECRAGGLLVGRGGLYGNTMRVTPPLSVTDDEIQEATQILVKAIAAADAEGAAP
ncbi:MAG: aspartate aminotransferase family protein [Actinomycetota bacterium]